MNNNLYPYVLQCVGMKKWTTGTTTISSFSTLYLTDNCTISFKDHFDNVENSVPFSSGFIPFMPKEILGVTGATVYLCHNGQGITDFLIRGKNAL